MSEQNITKFQAKNTVADQLKAIQSAQQTITVLLKNGAALTGKIEDVANGNLILTQLAGKEFFDAMVVIDEIAALEVRVKHA